MARKIIPVPGEGLQFVFDNDGLVHMKESVDTYNSLPITGNTENDVRYLPVQGCCIIEVKRGIDANRYCGFGFPNRMAANAANTAIWPLIHPRLGLFGGQGFSQLHYLRQFSVQ